MDRFKPRAGTGRFAFQYIDFMQAAAQKALANAFDDYIAVTDSFYVQGGELTSVPSGTGTQHTITPGVVCLAGEFMPLDGGHVLQAASQVVFLSIVDTGIDVYPVPNMDGQVDHVMRDRKAVMQVGVAYPVGSFSLALQRKGDIDMLRLRGRVVPKGSILPYFGSMTNFDATGLGLAGTPSEGWAVCNGLNGTIDMRGLVPIGATNVPSSGAGAPYEGVAPGAVNAGDPIGADHVVIAANNLPEHTHPYTYQVLGDSGTEFPWDNGARRQTVTGATGNNTTPNDPIDVRQASRALVFIQSIV